jgi:hypothetical protein
MSRDSAGCGPSGRESLSTQRFLRNRPDRWPDRRSRPGRGRADFDGQVPVRCEWEEPKRWRPKDHAQSGWRRSHVQVNSTGRPPPTNTTDGGGPSSDATTSARTLTSTVGLCAERMFAISHGADRSPNGIGDVNGS